MKKITLIGMALLGFLSFAVVAEEHADAALEHTRTAIQYGKSEHNAILVQHIKEALVHAKAAAEAASGESKTHMDAAVKSLESSLEHGKMRGKEHVKAATQAAQEAEQHIKAGNQ
ncbi:MAG: small metal-binding protein SmbP [Methylomicrobium sp.]